MGVSPAAVRDAVAQPGSRRVPALQRDVACVGNRTRRWCSTRRSWWSPRGRTPERVGGARGEPRAAAGIPQAAHAAVQRRARWARSGACSSRSSTSGNPTIGRTGTGDGHPLGEFTKQPRVRTTSRRSGASRSTIYSASSCCSSRSSAERHAPQVEGGDGADPRITAGESKGVSVRVRRGGSAATTSSAVVAERTAATACREAAGEQLTGGRGAVGHAHQDHDRSADLGERPPVDVVLARPAVAGNDGERRRDAAVGHRQSCRSRCGDAGGGCWARSRSGSLPRGARALPRGRGRRRTGRRPSIARPDGRPSRAGPAAC